MQLFCHKIYLCSEELIFAICFKILHPFTIVSLLKHQVFLIRTLATFGINCKIYDNICQMCAGKAHTKGAQHHLPELPGKRT
jgi:hypothetical protein